MCKFANTVYVSKAKGVEILYIDKTGKVILKETK